MRDNIPNGPQTSPEQRRKPGRPRSSQAHQAILDATLELLAEVGLQALSLEQVAACASVGKKTIYRRWPSKEALVSDAIRSIQMEMPIIDTGHLRADLIMMYRAALQNLQSRPLIRPLWKCQNSEQGPVMKGISPHSSLQKSTTCAHSLPMLEVVSPLRVRFPGRVLSSDTFIPAPPILRSR